MWNREYLVETLIGQKSYLLLGTTPQTHCSQNPPQGLFWIF